MGRTTLNSGQIRETGWARFFIGTNTYSLPSVDKDKIMIFEMRSWYPTPHVLKINNVAEGARLTVILYNPLSSVQFVELQIAGSESYQPSDGSPYSEKIYSGTALMLEFVKANGVLYMAVPPGTPLYWHEATV